MVITGHNVTERQPFALLDNLDAVEQKIRGSVLFAARSCPNAGLPDSQGGQLGEECTARLAIFASEPVVANPLQPCRPIESNQPDEECIARLAILASSSLVDDLSPPRHPAKAANLAKNARRGWQPWLRVPSLLPNRAAGRLSKLAIFGFAGLMFVIIQARSAGSRRPRWRRRSRGHAYHTGKLAWVRRQVACVF